MADNYRKELIQVAAVCLAAAQVAEMDSSSLGTDNEGIAGRFAFERLITEVREERRRQELKWGTRTGASETPVWWLIVAMEEVGEVAEEIAKTAPQPMLGIVSDIIAVGNNARQLLEMR